MAHDFSTWKQTRKNIHGLVSELSLDQLNTIPDGFNNNLAWHLGHVLVTQQLLVYHLSGRELRVEQTLIDRFRKGTSPDGPLTQVMVDTLKTQLLKTVIWTEEDLATPAEGAFTEYPTSYGITLHNEAEAVAFNTVHEGLHLGYMMAQRRLVK